MLNFLGGLVMKVDEGISVLLPLGNPQFGELYMCSLNRALVRKWPLIKTWMSLGTGRSLVGWQQRILGKVQLCFASFSQVWEQSRTITFNLFGMCHGHCWYCLHDPLFFTIFLLLSSVGWVLTRDLMSLCETAAIFTMTLWKKRFFISVEPPWLNNRSIKS